MNVEWGEKLAELNSHQIIQNKRHDKEMEKMQDKYDYMVGWMDGFFGESFWNRLKWLLTGSTIR